MSVATTVSAARSHESSATISISGAVDSTLTIEQLGFRSLVLTGSLTATVNVFFPATSSDIGSWWIVTNSTSGAYSVTCKNTTGTGIVVAQGKTACLKWDGTNLILFPTESVAAGFAASGANADITAMTGIPSGITMQGGLNVAGSVGGNSAATSAFTLAASAPSYASDANKTLSAAEYSCPVVVVTSGVSLTATRNLVVPLTGFWIVTNSTTGGQSIQVIGASGTGVTIANGKVAICRGNGTNITRVTADATP